MKVLLTTFNAKYIHTSLALRWLYVVNKDRFDISFVEYTIKEEAQQTAAEIVAGGYNVVGISVSIWNVELSRQLAAELKALDPSIVVIVGGPEVSYEPSYFVQNWEIDYLISGEGEFVLGELLSAIEAGEEVDIESVSTRSRISPVVARADINQLVTYPSPYQLEQDLKQLKNRVIYFETSRGCPYECQYCLSSLERGVRFFPQEYIEENLNYIIASETRQVRFLDRTFNLNKRHTAFVFDHLIDNHREGLSVQFEIYADLLNDAMIDSLNERLPKNYFRFEIGIQSTHEPTNLAVQRKQDFPLLARNIRRLMDGGKIDLHLDLIAGLPHESYDRFVQSFNDVFTLGAKEVQLGFLKLLRGTGLRVGARAFGFVYDENPPYEIISNKDITAEELERIRDAERALEKYWNSGRFKRTMQRLVNEEYRGRYFDLFDGIGQYYKKHQLPHIGYQLDDLFRNLDNFLVTQDIDLPSLMRDDYYDCFVIRPSGYWKETMPKQKRKRMLYVIGQDRDFLQTHGLTRRVVEKHCTVDEVDDGTYLLTVFWDGERKQIVYNDGHN